MQKKLPGLKPGQVVQFTYTEAVAASIRPTPPRKSARRKVTGAPIDARTRFCQAKPERVSGFA